MPGNSERVETMHIRCSKQTKERFYSTFDQWRVRNGHDKQIEDFVKEALRFMNDSMHPSVVT